MNSRHPLRRTLSFSLAALVMQAMQPSQAAAQQPGDWPQHSMERPVPPVVDPGPGALPVPPPHDAVVLFDGHSLGNWTSATGGPAKWTVRDGYFEVAPGTGSIQTQQGFGDAQLHVEWASPAPASGEGQDRGNSGVYLMGLYEVQVLDSYGNRTYADGQAAAIYGQYPPLVNASRAPGVWQSYDIVFRRPRFGADGHVISPAIMTVFHNGVLVQDHVELTGPTAHQQRPPYQAHADRLPISLQDHGHRVRYRNTWIRNLEGAPH
jgi:3-keto-disaccharide hydrolase